MLTPQELQNKKFEKAVFGGYDMSQVDDFLDSIIGDYTDIYKENITLKSKMKVLVDKIEEYRSVDDEIRKMLYTAQTKAKEMIANAEKEASNIINEARSTAESSIIEMKASYDNEKEKLAAMKAETSQYAEQIKAILNKNIDVINTLIEAAPVKEVVQPKKEEEFVKASPDTFEFELSSDVLEVLPYGVAADLLKSDVSNAYGNIYAQRYEQMKQQLDIRYNTGSIELEVRNYV
jgi:cell division initiation protein